MVGSKKKNTLEKPVDCGFCRSPNLEKTLWPYMEKCMMKFNLCTSKIGDGSFFMGKVYRAQKLILENSKDLKLPGNFTSLLKIAIYR